MHCTVPAARTRLILLCLSSCALIGSCNQAPASSDGGNVADSSAPKDTQAPLDSAVVPAARFADPAGDIFGINGEPVAGAGYFDIRESALTLAASGRYQLQLTLAAPIPDKAPDPSLFLEWDLLIESDLYSNNDTRWPLIWNDLGPDYLVRLRLDEAGAKAELIDTQRRKATALEYRKDGARLEISFGSELIGKPERFDYSLATQAYGDKGAPSALRLADKAPNAQHYQFPAGKQLLVKPGLPSAKLEATHATLHHNVGDEARAKWLAEAFDFGYTTLGQQLGVYAPKKFRLYVYSTQGDLVQGLMTFSGYPPEFAEFFKQGGAPRPSKYVMHVGPDFGWRGIFHEYTHTLIEERSGMAFLSIKWLDEGLAEHLAQGALTQSKCKGDAAAWNRGRLDLVKQALQHGQLVSLAELATEEHWGELMQQGLGNVIYAEGYAAASYAVATYGLDSCLAVLEKMKQGLDQEAALKAVLGKSLTELESGFRAWLGRQ